MFDMKLNIAPDVLFIAKPVNFIRTFNQQHNRNAVYVKQIFNRTS